MASKAVERASTQVPDLVRTPAMTLTSDDIALPRIYIGQFMSAAVQGQLVKAGQIFAATSGDDPDPQVLWTKGDDEGVLLHVIGLRKAKSFSEGGELQLFDFDDPNAPSDSWVTYNYMLALPEVDSDLPYKLLLTRTGRQTALKINTVLQKNSISGPMWNQAFRLTAAERENNKGKFYVAQAAQVEATATNIEIAANLASQITSAPVTASRSEEPAI
jgi:hypothetical protein